ncbi:conserved exported hypothetical protein [Arthrobacter sp. 9AX]|nr:conserved exported hypothetical protein [Arthrobacter sp. 9AX]
MLRPDRGPVLGLILTFGLSGFGVPAVAASEVPSGWLEVTAGPGNAMHNLAPGGSAQWPVDVQVPGERATILQVALHSGSAASGSLRNFLSVEVRACSEPWVQGQCGVGERLLLGRTPLSAAEGLQASLLEPGSADADSAHVVLTVFLADDVPAEVQGSSTQITVGVHGSGDDAGTGLTDGAGPGSLPGKPAGPPSNSLADTGARLGGFALLGLLAVAVGFGLARLRAS